MTTFLFLSYVVRMADTAAPAPAALYVVVLDGHTAADATYSLPGCVSRDEAIRVCDDANATAKNLGLASRWHAERVG